MSGQRNVSDALRAVEAAQRDLQPIAHTNAKIGAAITKLKDAADRLRRALPGIKD